MQVAAIGSTGGNYSPTKILVENSTQNTTPTPIILKVGNIKLQGDVVVANTTSTLVPSVSIVVMVFYLPEGLALDGSTAGTVANQHPEWILAWKMVDTGRIEQNGAISTPSFSVSSRLKRNLNSGDKICIGFMTDSSNINAIIKYTAQYWTCAN